MCVCVFVCLCVCVFVCCVCVCVCVSVPRMHRHNALGDAWANLFRQAGWTLLVHTREDYKRADLSATSPAAEDVAVDVMVTAPADLGICYHDLALFKSPSGGGLTKLGSVTF